MKEQSRINSESCLEASETCLANLRAILSNNGGEETIQGLYRSIYRNTSCGASLSVQLHNGKWKHTGELHTVKNDEVRSLLVSSIIEGSDSEVMGSKIDLLSFDDENQCVTRFNDELDNIDIEVDRTIRENESE